MEILREIRDEKQFYLSSSLGNESQVIGNYVNLRRTHKKRANSAQTYMPRLSHMDLWHEL